MAIGFRAAGTLAAATATTVAVPYPAGVVAGDLLVIQYGCAQARTPTTPAGWTKQLGPVTGSSGGNIAAHVYYRVAGGSEPASVTITLSASGNQAGIMTAYTGVDPTTPVDIHATANLPTSGTSATTPSVTTTKANTWLLRMYWAFVAGTTTITPAGTDTERTEAFFTAQGYDLELATRLQAAAGASGTTTATFSAACFGGIGATIAINTDTTPAVTFVPRITVVN